MIHLAQDLLKKIEQTKKMIAELEQKEVREEPSRGTPAKNEGDVT